MRRAALVIAWTACGHASTPPSAPGLPLTLVKEVELPGAATRFDYQDIDPAKGLLVIAHMNDNAVAIVELADGSLRRRLTNIPTPRGVAVAPEAGLIFVTSTPGHLVLIDDTKLDEVAHVETGAGPDGDAWDPDDKVVGVSDQHDGALSIIADAGRGARTQVKLGGETGNVVYDAGRRKFWITVVTGETNELVEVDPRSRAIGARIALPGCTGAHGLRIHPDGRSAFVACEDNAKLARVALDGDHAIALGATGEGPDVMAIDAGLGWLYVAAESGDLTVFDIARPGVALVGRDHPGAHAHSVAVDPATHRVFFPLVQGARGKPVLRIMRPST